MWDSEQDDETEHVLPDLDIRRESRVWSDTECRERMLTVRDMRFELIDGKLFWSDFERQLVLGMLLENLGMDAAIRLGDAQRWREAILSLDEQKLAQTVTPS
ncbi:MAG: hypothetical protein JNM83_26820 [Myxococcales bacterium]|jgi:hypothetical protein|nr:hypothetical protein [Myxococcales bacterium]